MAGENRTEKPTPRKRQKAREQGRVARSPEVGAALSLGVTLLLLVIGGSTGVGAWRRTLRWSLAMEAVNVRPAAGWMAVHEVALYWLYPALAGSVAIAIASSLVQGGLVWAPSLLKPSVERISPMAHVKRLFSPTSLTAMGKSLLPTLAMMYVALGILRREWASLCGSVKLGTRSYSGFLSSLVVELTWKCVLVLCVWAAVEFFVTRQRFEHDLKMTHQELREEAKESEGNPQVKSRIRKLQRQVRRKRMLDEVKRAAVVVTNPTEYAIALEYHEGLPAPLVIAKGRNLLAHQIKHAARWSGIPMIENVPLAHALYRTAEVGQYIPAKLYAAVAEILAFILRAETRAAAARGVRK
jgi:flagellar biosynthetic protein FlhB